MRLKKGFTLAEVLIVLVVIGAIATLTVPSLMKGVQAAQAKTAYKKGLNNIINIMAMEAASGNKPGSGSDAELTTLFNVLRSNLAVKDYAPDSIWQKASVSNLVDDVADAVSTEPECPSGTKEITSESDANKGKCQGAAGTTPVEKIAVAVGGMTPWINTEDGLSYKIIPNDNPDTPCPTKSSINRSDFDFAIAQADEGEITLSGEHSCMVVLVDTNGVTSGPNRVETNVIAENSPLSEITADQFVVFVGSDGASAGSKKTTVTGRIAADLK